MAARESFAGRFGPSFLEIPRDVLDGSVEARKAMLPQAGHYRASTSSIGDPRDIELVADLLVKSKQPCILFGQQVWTCRASAIAKAFAEKLNVPAYMNGAGRGTLEPDHPLHFGLTRRDAFADADLTIVVGTPFDFRLRYGQSLKSAKLVQIDMGYAAVGRNRDITHGLVGDVGAILAAILRATSGRGDTGALARTAWVDALRAKEQAAVDARMPRLMNASKLIHPYRLAHEIDKFLTDNSIFIGDGGDVVTFAGNVVRPKGPGLWMDPGPLGTLGVGTGFALAAKMVAPQREVVALFGDGSFAMTAFDMQTAIRDKAPYIAIVGNNSYMNQIRFGQIQKYGRERGNVGNYLGDVHFEKFADMLGVYGEAVHDPADIAPALRRARESGTCAIINVWLDPDAYAPGTENQTMYK
jgi:acetolactate synthase-1/2/3 large subunit